MKDIQSFVQKKCAYASPDRMESIFKTNLERYGVKMSSMLPEYVEKQKQTYKQRLDMIFQCKIQIYKLNPLKQI